MIKSIATFIAIAAITVGTASISMATRTVDGGARERWGLLEMIGDELTGKLAHRPPNPDRPHWELAGSLKGTGSCWLHFDYEMGGLKEMLNLPPDLEISVGPRISWPPAPSMPGSNINYDGPECLGDVGQNIAGDIPGWHWPIDEKSAVIDKRYPDELYRNSLVIAGPGWKNGRGHRGSNGG